MRSAGKNRRDEIVISRMRFGHTRLNSTLYKMGKHDMGRCEFCGQEESVEHVILYCQKYETERRILMQNLEKIKMQFKLRDILQNDSRNESYSFIFQYLKITNLWERILKKKKKKRGGGEVVSHFDPHSIPVGGGNTLFCCLSTANTF